MVHHRKRFHDHLGVDVLCLRRFGALLQRFLYIVRREVSQSALVEWAVCLRHVDLGRCVYLLCLFRACVRLKGLLELVPS